MLQTVYNLQFGHHVAALNYDNANQWFDDIRQVAALTSSRTTREWSPRYKRHAVNV